MPRIPVSILTGFLGSGKTTLLNRALHDPSMASTAVVINEFGEISLDHALVTRSDDTIMVLENGCLCCTVFGDLVATLNRLYHAREDRAIPAFDHVVIETSGLADPSPLRQAFLSDPVLAGLYTLKNVVATVDAVNGHGTLDRHIESVHQIALADYILVTKLTLVEPASRQTTQESLIARLRRLNWAAKISDADSADLDIAGLLRFTGVDPTTSNSDAINWLNADAYQQHRTHAHGADHHRDDDEHHHHLHDRDIASFCFVKEDPIPQEALRLLLDALQQNLGPNLLRVKGIINVAEEPDRPAVIQGAQQLLHNLTWLDRWPSNERQSKIVFITHGFDQAEVEDMIATLDRVAVRTAAARSRAKRDK